MYHFREETVRVLIEKGANLNTPSPRYQNALLATSHTTRPNTYRIFETLLRAGTDPDASGSPGSAIQTITHRGQTKLVQLLLDNGMEADIPASNLPDAYPGYYGSVLAVASASDHSDTVRSLLDHGADVNLRLNNDFGSALAVAFRYGCFRSVKLLLE